MLLLFAQAGTSPTFTPNQFWAAAGIAVFVLSSIVLARKVFGHEPPLHKEYVTKHDHETSRREILDELKRHAGRRAEIYDQQKEQGEQIAALESATKNLADEARETKEAIRDVNNRIDEIPARTIRMLNETKSLHSR